MVTTYTKNSDGTYTKTVKTPGTLNFVNPEPMPLAGTKLPITKKWNEKLDSSHLEKLITDAEAAGKTYSVTLNVLQNGSTYMSFTFEPVKTYYTDNTYATVSEDETAYYKYTWPSKYVNIAPALLVTQKPDGASDTAYKTVTIGADTYYVLNDGHEYTITEDPTGDYHFEFSADPYHPSLLDSASDLTNVEFKVDDNGAIVTQTTAQISGDGTLEEFEAYNSLTSELDITKLIVDETGQMTAAELDAETFTYKITLTVPANSDASNIFGYEFVPRLTDTYNGTNRIYIHGYQGESDTSTPFAEDATRFKEQVYGRWNSFVYEAFAGMDSTQERTVTVYMTLARDEVLRINNLPLGTKYVIEEVAANVGNADSSNNYTAPITEFSVPTSGTPAAQGYTTVTSKSGTSGSDETTTNSANNGKVTGAVTVPDTRYYNQFTNTRTQLTDSVRAELKVKKVVDGYTWGSEYYRMSVTAGEATYSDGESPATGTSPAPAETQKIDIKNTTPDHTLAFGDVLFSRPGTYTYTIHENDNSANMPSVQFADDVTVTITVKADASGKLYIDDVEDNSGTEGNSFWIAAAGDGSSLGSVITTMTNKSQTIDLQKVDSSNTSKVVDGAVFELRQGKEKVYVDANMQILTKDQVLALIDADDITSDTAAQQMADLGIASTFSIGKTSLKGFAFTGYTYAGGELTQNTPVVYELVEISAPAGYVITQNNNYFKVVGVPKVVDGKVRYTGLQLVLTDADGNDLTADEIAEKNATVDASSLKVAIANEPGVELPSTGGVGTTAYTAVGTALIALCAVLLLRRRRA